MKKNPFLISIIFTASVTSCNAAQDPIQANSIVAADGNTTAGDTLQFENKINELRKAMTSYMETAHPPYSKKDIDSCINILSQFIADMAGAKTREEGMILVKDAVQKLNRLNQKCDTQLIETNEREIIADIIIAAGYQKGYNGINEDITEAFREW